MKVAIILLVLPVLFAQNRPDLVIDGLSVNSTLANTSGQRQINVSFRVRNQGSAVSPATHTRVAFNQTHIDFPTPRISPGQVAYIGNGTSTNAPQISVSITVDVLQEATESNEANNTFSQTYQLAQPDFMRWQSIGPAPIIEPNGSKDVGRVTAILIDPRFRGIVYAGARHSGLWRTPDGGTTWFPLTDAMPTLTVDALAMDPENPDRLLMATPKGLFQSTSSGAVWSLINAADLNGWGSDGGALIISHKPQIVAQPLVAGGVTTSLQQPTLYLSTINNGLIISRDNGANWTTVVAANSPIGSVKLSADESKVFASVSTGGPAAVGIYQGDNGGHQASDWHKLVGCPAGPLPAMPASSRVTVGESHGTIWASFVAGSADNRVHQILHTTGATCQVNGRTENVWQRVQLSGDCDDPNNQWSYLFVHPADPSVVFKAGVHLCRAASGGPFTQQPGPHDDHHAIAFYPPDPSVMYMGNDGGIYRSDDKGANWRFVGDGLAVTEFLNLDTSGRPGRIVAGGTQDNDVSGWNNTSPVWTHVGRGATDVPLIAFDGADQTILYKMDQKIKDISKHLENGTAQNIGGAPLPDLFAYSETPSLSAGMAATGGSPPLVVTGNGLWTGPPWQRKLAPPADGDFNRVQRGPTGAWIAGTAGGRVFTGSSPSTLNQVFTSAGTRVTALAAGVPMSYVAIMPGPHLFQCPLQGPCIAAQLPPMPNPAEITAMVIDGASPNGLIVAVQGGGVFRGVRSGSTLQWTALNNGLPAGIVVTDLKRLGTARVALGSYGRGAFVITTGALITAVPERLVVGQVGNLRPIGNRPVLDTQSILGTW